MRIHPLAALLAALVSHPALAATPASVAIAVDTNSLAPKIADEVQDGAVAHIVTGLDEVMSTLADTDIRLTPVSDSETLDRILECEAIECLQDLSEAAKVDLVIQVRVRAKQISKKATKRSKPDYLISMIVARSVPEREAWVEKTDCHACDASGIKHTASLLASTIAEHIKVRKAPPAPEPEEEPTAATPPRPAAPPAPSAASPAPPEARPSPKLEPTRSEPQRVHVPTYLSATAIVGGGLLIGSGIYLVHINGKGTCDLTGSEDLCERQYKTESLGIGLLAGGGLAVLGGLVGLIFYSHSAGGTPIALNCNGSSIFVSGGF